MGGFLYNLVAISAALSRSPNDWSKMVNALLSVENISSLTSKQVATTDLLTKCGFILVRM